MELITGGSLEKYLKEKKRLDWDGPKMKATNTSEAEKYVKFETRKGWELPT